MKASEPYFTDKDLEQLERDTFSYFANEMNAENGLVFDSTRQGAPSSIAAVGFALTAYPIAVERASQNVGTVNCGDFRLPDGASAFHIQEMVIEALIPDCI